MKHKFYWMARELVIKGSNIPSTSLFFHSFLSKKTPQQPRGNKFRKQRSTFTEFIQFLLHDQQQTTIDETFYMCRERMLSKVTI